MEFGIEFSTVIYNGQYKYLYKYDDLNTIILYNK